MGNKICGPGKDEIQGRGIEEAKTIDRKMYEGPMGSNLSKISLISAVLPIYSVLDRENKDFLR